MNIETLLQLLQGLREELGALACLALGLILPVCILVGLIVLRWVRRGGLAPGRTVTFFAEQREIKQSLKKG